MPLLFANALLRWRGRPDDSLWRAFRRSGKDPAPARQAVLRFTDWPAVLAALGLTGEPAVDINRAL